MDLLAVYSVLYSHCHISLRNYIENEPEYQVMKIKKRFDTINLFKLVNKNCNDLMTVVTSENVGNLIEALYNYMQVRVEDY